MSNITTERKKQEELNEKRGIVNYFYAYCNHTYGSQKWEEYMHIEEFKIMMEEYRPIFGDDIFSVLVDSVSEIENISIKNLLADFSNFINAYY